MTVAVEARGSSISDIEAMRIVEAASVAGAIQPDGTVLVHIIRPGIGRGRGRRYYGPEMLRENAHKWSGARMFLNHETEKQRREREGLPRDLRELGGRVLESWWDESVPGDSRFEPGAVVGRVKPTKLIREMLEDDPELLEVSIDALATATKPGKHRSGVNVSIVEGIRDTPQPRVDWIAGDAGAGGRVLLEAADEEEAVLESLPDEEFREYLERERPELVEALRARSGNRYKEGEGVPDTPAELLQEALATDEGKAALVPVLREALAEAFADFRPTIDDDEIKRLVEGTVTDTLALAGAEARSDFDRRIELRDMEKEAHRLIEAAKLHPTLSSRLKGEFKLDGEEPSAALNVAAETDAEGNVVRPAMEVLRESVEERVSDAKKLQAELGTRTRVRGQGASSSRVGTRRKDAAAASAARLQEGADSDAEEKVETTTGSPLTDLLLTRAGVPQDQLGNLWAR